MACQQPRRPQLVRIAVLLCLLTRQRHQPGLGLRRNRRLLARSGPVVERCQRAIGYRPLDAALDRLMMNAKSLSHPKERGIITITKQYLRPLYPARRLASRARNGCQLSNLILGHRQLDRLPPSCHDAIPRSIKHITGNPRTSFRFHGCPFHGIGRLVVLALWVHAISTTALAWFLLWNGLFMGTVMGVVQVTVQSASGALKLGEAAASVQFSRSIGAALGTALVAATLFADLSMKNPETARAFATLVESGGQIASSLPPAKRAAIRADIADAFSAAFLSVAAFTTLGFFLAVAIPLRRI